MTVGKITTIQFSDAESGEEAIAIIRAMKERIALCLSLRGNGDVEVFFQVEDCKSLIKALEQAILVS